MTATDRDALPQRIGIAILTMGWVGLGLVGLLNGDFSLQWQPVPPDLPLRLPLALLSALILVGSGAALIHRRTRRYGAALLALDFLFWVLALKLPAALAQPGAVGSWLGVAENTTLLIGPLVLACLSPAAGWLAQVNILDSPRTVRVAQILFAICCLEFGASHFVYADFTAAMIPGWIPGHLALAWFTGGCHAAAGLAILFSVFPRLAACLEAVMMGLFALLLHLPSVFLRPLPTWGPSVQSVWVMLFIATTLSGSAWLVAASIKPSRTTMPPSLL